MKELLQTLMICMILFSCENKVDIPASKPIEVKSEWETSIEHLAGDNLEIDGFDPLPIIFNTGKIAVKNKDDIETMVLGQRLNKRKKMYIKPIGLFSFEKDSLFIEYVVSVPKDDELNNFDINSYFDLNQKNYATKYLVEDWFRTACQTGRCKNFSWGNELKALKRLE